MRAMEIARGERRPAAHEAERRSERAARLLERFRTLRRTTLALAAPLSAEDCAAQSMPEASPVKWHLAHTSWFFETFVLAPGLPGHQPFHPRFGFLFNSYYNAGGERAERPQRGLQTRPSLEEVLAYRRHVDERIKRWLEGSRAPAEVGLLDVLELGLNHEEQHQELILTDVKHLLSHSVLDPVYASWPPASGRGATALRFLAFEGGRRRIGHEGPGFAFDNEGPAHDVLLAPFELASRPVTCGEYLEFVESGGYSRPEAWLSDGWDFVRSQGIQAPLYWRRDEAGWTQFTLSGRRALDPAEPVCHLSYYEADAYARFRGARLPREEEWEVAAAEVPVEGNFADSGAFHPLPSEDLGNRPAALFGDVWEWTQSPYVAYPGYRAPAGALGEYNGKFMCNQMVLRGGSCASPRGHLRATYRNFFPPSARWQFSGLRLARDA